MAIIHPIPKESGIIFDPLKYRGLALQCCMYKIMSNVLNTRILNYLEFNDLLEESQNGFRRNRSCMHHLFTLNTLLQNKLQEGHEMYCCFVDF